MKCCFCEKEINSRESHSAIPVKPGERCCGECSDLYVLPYRIVLSEDSLYNKYLEILEAIPNEDFEFFKEKTAQIRKDLDL